jgi:hypothetical protein
MFGFAGSAGFADVEVSGPKMGGGKGFCARADRGQTRQASTRNRMLLWRRTHTADPLENRHEA